MLISHNNNQSNELLFFASVLFSSAKHFRHMTQHEWPFKLRHFTFIHPPWTTGEKTETSFTEHNERRKKENESNRLCGNPYSRLYVFFSVCRVHHAWMSEWNQQTLKTIVFNGSVQTHFSHIVQFKRLNVCSNIFFLPFRRFRLLFITHFPFVMNYIHTHTHCIFDYVDQCSVAIDKKKWKQKKNANFKNRKQTKGSNVQ